MVFTDDLLFWLGILVGCSFGMAFAVRMCIIVYVRARVPAVSVGGGAVGSVAGAS